MIDLLEGPDAWRHAAERTGPRGRYRFVALESDVIAVWRVFRELRRERPALLCINDDMRVLSRGVAGWALRRFLRRQFPWPSSYERTW